MLCAQTDLLRIVIKQGDLRLDLDRKVAGRGAYIHPDGECLTTAIRRKAFERSFRSSVNVHKLNEDLSHYLSNPQSSETGA
jgi:predicted RNA-binding protein YlxR (DUF448 family)